MMNNNLEMKMMIIVGAMEKHIKEANIISMRDVKGQDILESNFEELLSDEMWTILEKGRDAAYLDLVIFDSDLYFIIIDEYLYVKCGNASFEIDGIMSETIYNMFRDLVLNSKCKTIQDII